MALTNRSMDPDFDTIFLVASSEFIFLSARVVREVATLGGDISKMVPKTVADHLARKFPSPTS
jgi:pantetheine-phosphate adenylyltransferase